VRESACPPVGVLPGQAGVITDNARLSLIKNGASRGRTQLCRRLSPLSTTIRAHGQWPAACRPQSRAKTAVCGGLRTVIISARRRSRSRKDGEQLTKRQGRDRYLTMPTRRGWGLCCTRRSPRADRPVLPPLRRLVLDHHQARNGREVIRATCASVLALPSRSGSTSCSATRQRAGVRSGPRTPRFCQRRGNVAAMAPS
jgi:hypothetical protein